jgi:hypothetical protein
MVLLEKHLSSGLQYLFLKPLLLTKILKFALGSLLPNNQFIEGSCIGSQLLVAAAAVARAA